MYLVRNNCWHLGCILFDVEAAKGFDTTSLRPDMRALVIIRERMVRLVLNGQSVL